MCYFMCCPLSLFHVLSVLVTETAESKTHQADERGGRPVSEVEAGKRQGSHETPAEGSYWHKVL